MEVFFLCTHLVVVCKVLKLSSTYIETVGDDDKEDFCYNYFLEGRVR